MQVSISISEMVIWVELSEVELLNWVILQLWLSLQ